MMLDSQQSSSTAYDDNCRQQQQQRAEVLDSSDEEEEGSSCHSHSSTLIHSNTHGISHSVGNNARSNRSWNNGVGGGSRSRQSADKQSSISQGRGKATDHTVLVLGTLETTMDGCGNTSDSTDYDDEGDDDELMNPYVMNPFRTNNRLDDFPTQQQAPSMALEMAAISTSNSKNDIGGGTQRKSGEACLANFDPYSSSKRQDEMEMEMEEEVEFLPNDDGNNNAQEQQNGWSMFGPLLHEPSAPSPLSQDGRQEEPSFASSSFSPFPKHEPKNSPRGYVTSLGNEYGENTPLSNIPSSSSAAHGGRDNGAGGQASAPQSGIPGIAIALLNIPKAMLSSLAYTLTSLLHGPQSQSTHNNPFSQSHHPHRLNVRMSRGNQRRSHWGMLSYFRFFAVAMAVLFCLGTMTAMWHVPNVASGTVEVVDRSRYQGQEMINGKNGSEEGGTSEMGLRSTSIVLKKMKKAKQHWWNKNRAELSGHQELNVEVYRDGEKEQAVVAAAGVQQQQQTVVENVDTTGKNYGQGNNAMQSASQAVIVQTEEDGTLLIKLPPPKMNLEEPKVPRENPSPPLGNSLEQIVEDEEETMYIKLPYPQQQQQQNRRTLTEAKEGGTMKQELEPPLRGAAIPLSQSQHEHHFNAPPPMTKSNQHGHHGGYHHSSEEEHGGVFHALRNEFDSWMSHHGKAYGSHQETEHRFNVWRKNHVRIKEKNQKHGPCRMTGKAVFGHNLFSDLDPEEFQSKFLTGYRGPRHHDGDHKNKRKKKGGKGAKSHSYFRETTAEERPMPEASSVKRHPSIQRKLEEHTAMYGGGLSSGSRLNGAKYQANFANGCRWWDISCALRWVFGYQFVGGTREPVYDESSYPSVLDWRAMGVVSDVHSQGSCGACWAITAVETIESANAVATGQLLDLAEEEVIACDGTCEMCNGGWPQNAYEYAMNHDGLPAKNAEYDADWLYTVTAVLAGESYDASEYEMGSYFAQTCPAGVREGGDGGSGDSKSSNGGGYQYDASYVETTRYGQLKGYGYATDRCICYTDGSGCDCDDQDEKTAVLNVASYGPTAVCLEASLWQDYEGGIMTSDIGCSKSFLDMNHCVQVVGYAFTDDSNSGNDDNMDGNNGGSGSGSNDSGSRDDSQREGYWIIKNQWSNYWGMSGYAYLAMGGNTCGVLNDMTQVYMK